MDNLPSHGTSQANRIGSHELVDRLFLRFAMSYGKHWLDMWEGLPIDAVKAEWTRALTGVSPEQMKLALDALNENGNTFPPTLPEFVSLCRKFQRAAYPPRLAHAREPAPEGAFKALRSLLANVPRETDAEDAAGGDA